MNIGTGRETKVFHELGAKNVYHFDISDNSVSALKKFKKENKITNIYTKQLDICAVDNLNIKDAINLVYLHGVLIHLNNPKRAINNIFDVLDSSCKLYFSIYRSGSFVFFITDFVRKFINFNDRFFVEKIFNEKFEKTINGRLQGNSVGKVNKERFHTLYSVMWDDFFVPTVHLYSVKELNDFFSKNGFLPVGKCDQGLKSYDHHDSGIQFQSPLLFLERKGKNHLSFDSATDFPAHVDQMENIDYKEDYINKSIQMMNEFLLKVETMEDAKRINFALDIFAFAQKEIENVEDVALFRHQTIQEQLRKVLY